MRSELPKVLHPVCGRALVTWPILAAREAGGDRIAVIVSPGRDISAALPEGTETVIQPEANGTGGAIRAAQDAGIFVILYNTASEGYQDLGVAYVGQEFIPAGIVSGRNAAKYAKEITGRDDGIIILGTIAPGHSALDARMEGALAAGAQTREGEMDLPGLIEASLRPGSAP